MAKFVFGYNLNGGNTVPATSVFPVAAGQTLAVGDVVKLVSGRVVKAGDATARVLGTMAQPSVAAAAGTLVRVVVAAPGQVYVGGSSADATATVLGSRTYDLTAGQLLDVADATNGCVRVVALGTRNTEVHVVFTACELM